VGDQAPHLEVAAGDCGQDVHALGEEATGKSPNAFIFNCDRSSICSTVAVTVTLGLPTTSLKIVTARGRS